MRFEDKESHDITEKTLISASAAWKKCEDWGDLGMKSGAIFDMDGLLLDTERVYQENWLKTAEAFGQTPMAEFAAAVTGTNGEVRRKIIHRYYPAVAGSGSRRRIQSNLHRSGLAAGCVTIMIPDTVQPPEGLAPHAACGWQTFQCVVKL